MKRVLVTGAAGFVGANLTKRLVADGHEVNVLVRPSSSLFRLDDVKDELKIHTADLSDTEAITSIINAACPQWIFHLAVHGAYSWQTDAMQMVSSNIIGTSNLLESCAKQGFEAFVNTGSSSEYGLKDHAPLESEAIEPNSYYSVTKAAATMYCRYVARSRNLNVPTLRLYSAYGPWEDPNRFVPTLITCGMEGKLPPLVDAATARDFVYIDDVIEAYILAATTAVSEAGAIYNVGTAEQSTIGEIVGIAKELLNVSEDPKWGSMSNRHWDTSVWVSDNRKLIADLGWQPQFNIQQGLRKTIEWFKANPAVAKIYRKEQLLVAK